MKITKLVERGIRTACPRQVPHPQTTNRTKFKTNLILFVAEVYDQVTICQTFQTHLNLILFVSGGRNLSPGLEFLWPDLQAGAASVSARGGVCTANAFPRTRIKLVACFGRDSGAVLTDTREETKTMSASCAQCACLPPAPALAAPPPPPSPGAPTGVGNSGRV